MEINTPLIESIYELFNDLDLDLEDFLKIERIVETHIIDLVFGAISFIKTNQKNLYGFDSFNNSTREYWFSDHLSQQNLCIFQVLIELVYYIFDMKEVLSQKNN